MKKQIVVGIVLMVTVPLFGCGSNSSMKPTIQTLEKEMVIIVTEVNKILSRGTTEPKVIIDQTECGINRDYLTYHSVIEVPDGSTAKNMVNSTVKYWVKHQWNIMKDVDPQNPNYIRLNLNHDGNGVIGASVGSDNAETIDFFLSSSCVKRTGQVNKDWQKIKNSR